MLNKPPKKKRPHNKLLVLTAASFQMGVTIYLGAYLGDYLQSTYLGAGTHLKTICVVLSVFISIYMLIKQTKNLTMTKFIVWFHLLLLLILTPAYFVHQYYYFADNLKTLYLV